MNSYLNLDLDIEVRVGKFLEESVYPFWSDWEHVLKIVKTLVFFLFSILLNYFAVRYATEHAGTKSEDLFFNFLPYADLYNFDYYFSFFLYGFAFLLVILLPKFAPKLLIYTGSLTILRSLFVNLTYLGIPGPNPLKTFFTQGGDLFFSGHVALPFMLALVFWEKVFLRYLFLCASLIMSAEVLLGRQHYAIDVFAAFFITHSLFTFLEKYFKKSPF